MSLNDLQHNYEFFDLIINSLDNIIFIVDKDLNIMEYNKSLSEKFKSKDKKLVGVKCGNALGCSHTSDNKHTCGTTFFCNECDIRRTFDEVLKNKSSLKQIPVSKEFVFEKEVITKHFLMSAKYMEYSDQEVAVVILDDITELAESQLKLEKLLVTDFLTGVYNRRFLFSELNLLKSSSERYSTCFSIIMVDLDHFKSVNDTLGHQVGDRVLSKIGKFFTDTLRTSDIVGRYGGEEFMLILPHTDEESAYKCAERLRIRIGAMDFGIDLPVTISCGVAQFEHGMTIEELILKADTLLYSAKDNGRNRTESSNEAS